MNFLSDFGVQPILLAAQVVNFFVLLFILKKLLYGPILKVLSERRKRIEDSLKNAEEIERKLQETNEKIEKMMVKATEDVQKLLDEGKKEKEAMKEEARQVAATQAQFIVKKAQDEAKLDKERLMDEGKENLAQLVALAVQKVTGKAVLRDEQKQIIEREVKNIS